MSAAPRGRGSRTSWSTFIASALIAAACSGTTPPTSPSSAPTPSSTAAPATHAPAQVPVPAELRFLWVGEPRDVPGLTTPANAAGMKLGAGTLQLFPVVEQGEPLEPMLVSTADVADDGSIRFALRSDGLGCHAGDTGTYRLAVSTTARAVMASAIADDCAARAAAIAGGWVRAACPTNQWCLGDLDAGPHVSINYRPFGNWDDQRFEYGKFAYTVPDGWTNPEDSIDGYPLIPIDAPDGTGVFVFSDVRAHKQGAACPLEPAPGVDGSSKAILAWLRDLPGLSISSSRRVEVGGLAGTQLDVSMAATWKHFCPWNEGGRDLPLFMNVNHDDFEWGLGGETHMRLFVLELAPDRTLVIDIEGPDAATWQALLPVAMPIVESFEFRR